MHQVRNGRLLEVAFIVGLQHRGIWMSFKYCPRPPRSPLIYIYWNSIRWFHCDYFVSFEEVCGLSWALAMFGGDLILYILRAIIECLRHGHTLVDLVGSSHYCHYPRYYYYCIYCYCCNNWHFSERDTMPARNTKSTNNQQITTITNRE